jgi:hypothetical protein
MNRASRESVYAALFALLQSVPGLTTVSRRLQNVQDVQPENFPAAFQLQGMQQSKYTGNTPSIFTWKAEWLLYVHDSDPTSAPSIQLNNLIDAATALLTPGPAQPRQDLGGLVQYAAIDGDIQVFEGVLGDRAVAVVPITILLPGF